MHAIDRDIEFLGDHLGDADVGALPHVELAEIGVDRAVGVDAEIGREFRGVERGALVERDGRGARGQNDARQGDGDDERARCGDDSAAIGLNGHLFAPSQAVAARLTARRIATWVPQRHLRPDKASRICASLGFGFFSSRATLVITQPLRQ